MPGTAINSTGPKPKEGTGVGRVMAEDHIVEKVLRDTMGAVHTEDLFVEAVRDLVKDEVKAYIHARLEANPALKIEIRAAGKDLMEAKVREAYAVGKLAKAGTKAGLELGPPERRDAVTK